MNFIDDYIKTYVTYVNICNLFIDSLIKAQHLTCHAHSITNGVIVLGDLKILGKFTLIKPVAFFGQYN